MEASFVEGCATLRGGAFASAEATRSQHKPSLFGRAGARCGRAGITPGFPKRLDGVDIPPTEFFVLSTASANFCLAVSVPDGMMSLVRMNYGLVVLCVVFGRRDFNFQRSCVL